MQRNASDVYETPIGCYWPVISREPGSSGEEERLSESPVRNSDYILKGGVRSKFLCDVCV